MLRKPRTLACHFRSLSQPPLPRRWRLFNNPLPTDRCTTCHLPRLRFRKHTFVFLSLLQNMECTLLWITDITSSECTTSGDEAIYYTNVFDDTKTDASRYPPLTAHYKRHSAMHCGRSLCVRCRQLRVLAIGSIAPQFSLAEWLGTAVRPSLQVHRMSCAAA